MTAPTPTPQAYYLMQSQWGRYGGEPVTYGLSGHGESRTFTPFMYPGDPVTGSYWSMENLDGLGTRHGGGTMRPVMASGPFRMEPGETQEIVYAIVWQRGNDRLDSITGLRGVARALHAAYRDLMALEPDTSPLAIPHPDRTVVRSVSPNPASETATLVIDVAHDDRVAVELLDLLGRRVLTLDDRWLPAGEHTLSLPVGARRSGIYVWRVGVRFAWASGTLAVTH